ncbi:uncharacterized protein [Halyomorpha halys]|uniref:uncharacterized protein isoform X2 n=1 Tax=Halyomorpha halys TaxID=286706 RepID=UPI0006D4DA15|nr:uncharacterized protein LOC106691398 isoform X2 [Halyomorpha halys]
MVNFITTYEKRKQSEKAVNELDPFIKSEIKELEVLNILFNESLNKYTYAWDDLKSHLNEEQLVGVCLNKYLNMIYFNNQINKNVNEHLQNDFNEIKPVNGKINVTPLDYWLIIEKLSEIENSIIDTTATIHGNSAVIDYLTLLKRIISLNPQDTSLLDIKKFLDEVPSLNEKLNGVLSPVLEDEVNSLIKLQINDTKKCAAFLEDRFNRLTRIENILQNKIILNKTLKFIVKRDRVISEFQFNTLNKFSKNIELLASQHDQRIQVMKNHTNVNKIHSLDPNYKAMMKYCGLQNSDYKTLSLEMANFKESLSISYAYIEEGMQLFQKKFIKKFNEIKKIDHLVVAGPTREIFGNYILRNFITALRDSFKTQKKISDTFTKVEEMFKTVKSGGRKKDCIWQKILENPKEFIRRLHEIEEETEQLKERVRIEVMNR